MSPHDISTPAQAAELTREDFYASLTQRNRGIVSDELQAKISETKVLIAGCGSIGGAVVQPLTRMGYWRFTLADVGCYELNNLNRQHAFVESLGVNKAVFAAEVIRKINPFAEIQVHETGVTLENAVRLAESADVIIDGVDVTTQAGLDAKLALHRSALCARKPLITAWDMAGMLAVQYFDYRKIRRVFDGEISEDSAKGLSLWETVFRIAPRQHIPAEMFREIRHGLIKPDYSVPQVVDAATQFGSLAVHVANCVVDGVEIPKNIAVDVHDVVRTTKRRVIAHAMKHWERARFLASLPPKQAWNGFAPAPLFHLSNQFSRPPAVSNIGGHHEE